MLALLFVVPAGAQVSTGPELRRCTALSAPAELRPGDLFGCALDAFGDLAVIGSVLDDSAGRDAGALYVYRRNAAGGFVQEDFFTAAGVRPGDRLGYAVKTDGGRILAGAPFHDDGARDGGGAWLFQRTETGWAEEAKLRVGTFGGGLGQADQFGYAVAIDGGLAAVGAPGDDDGGDAAGAVYVFVNGQQGWAPVAKLTASDAAVGDGFGSSVAVSAGTILVGAPYRDGPGREAGAVYLFEPGVGATWNEAGRFEGDGGAGSLYGHAVDLDAASALVGARSDDRAGDNAGTAYLYFRGFGDLVLEQRLTVPGPPSRAVTDGDELGISVALGDDLLLVGARFDDEDAMDSGAVYLFRLDEDGNWGAREKLKLATPGAGDEFGYAVALAGETVLAGAYLDDGAGTDAGVACSFTEGVPPPPPPPTIPTDLMRVTLSCAADVWTATVTNVGATPVSGATFSWTPPGSAPFPTCAPGPVPSCAPATVPTLQPGASTTYVLTAPRPVCRSFTTQAATARVTLPAGSGEVVTGNNVAGCTVTADPTNYDLGVAYTVVPASGVTLTYEVTVTNPGAGPADGTLLTVTPPAAPFSLMAAAPSCGIGGTSCPLGSLEAGGSRSLTFTYAADCSQTPGETFTVSHAAMVTADLPMCGGSAADDAATSGGVTFTCPDDVSVDKAGPLGPIVFGDVVEYTVTLTNNGDTPADDVRFVDTLTTEGGPPVFFDDPVWSCEPGAGAVCPPLPAPGTTTDLDLLVPLIPPMETVVLTLTGRPLGDCVPGLELINRAALPEIEPELGGRSSTVTNPLVPPGGVCAQKIVASGSQQEGASITYLVTLFNGTGVPIPDGVGPEFTDTLPPSLGLTGATASSGVVMTIGNTVSWNGTIPAGSTVEIEITALIGAGTTGTTICNQGLLVPTGTLTDDPDEPGLEDPTCILVTLTIPTLGWPALVLLVLMLGGAGWRVLRRRKVAGQV